MIIHQDLKQRIERSFDLLRSKAAASSMPSPASLSNALTKNIKGKKIKDSVNIHIAPLVATMFTTAAVEMWLRAVHSFLISASLTDVSPIWSSVSGYYSSHYSIRAHAHTLGYFQLYEQKCNVHLGIDKHGKYICTFSKKNSNDREHKYYWKTVKQDKCFTANDLFTLNNTRDLFSDCGHREHANYSDHLNGFPQFHPLDQVALKRRIDKISTIEISSHQIPEVSKYPDLEAVQVVAYHRLVHFRCMVDEVIGGKNSFWNVNRNPNWAWHWTNFQLVQARVLGEPNNS
jgi:hypothetical protein